MDKIVLIIEIIDLENTKKKKKEENEEVLI